MIELEQLITDQIMAEICGDKGEPAPEEAMKLRHGIQGSYITLEGVGTQATHHHLVTWCREQDVQWETIAERANYRLVLIRDREAATLCYLANR